MIYRNAEGYADPTAGEALMNVRAEEKAKRDARHRRCLSVCSMSLKGFGAEKMCRILGISEEELDGLLDEIAMAVLSIGPEETEDGGAQSGVLTSADIARILDIPRGKALNIAIDFGTRCGNVWVLSNKRLEELAAAGTLADYGYAETEIREAE